MNEIIKYLAAEDFKAGEVAYGQYFHLGVAIDSATLDLDTIAEEDREDYGFLVGHLSETSFQYPLGVVLKDAQMGGEVEVMRSGIISGIDYPPPQISNVYW